MDPLVVIENLKRLFRDVNKQGEKYVEVWLSPVEFDNGERSSKHFVLNAIVNHKLGETDDELTPLVALVKDREEYRHLWRVYVFDPEDELHCESDEILIYGG
jgi:hypothetical protein